MNIAVAATDHDNETTISEAFEREGEPGVWSIEEIGSDGEIYQAIFIGPDGGRSLPRISRLQIRASVINL